MDPSSNVFHPEPNGRPGSQSNKPVVGTTAGSTAQRTNQESDGIGVLATMLPLLPLLTRPVADQPSWLEFLKCHELEELWDTTEITEQQKYATIVENLKQAQQRHRHKEEQLRYIAAEWHSKKRKRFDIHPAYENVIAEVANTAHSVETKWRERQFAEDQFSKRLNVSQHAHAQGQGRLITVELRDMDYEDGVFRVQVWQYLRDTRYYFGHDGGDYIFRYTESKFNILGLPKKELGPLKFSNALFFDSDGDIEVPENAHEQLRYAGQVPRPLKQYVRRMMVILPDILRMLWTMTAFENESERRSFRETHRDHYDKPLSLTYVVELSKKWRERYPRKDSVPDLLAKEAASHYKILEFIHLFCKIYAVSHSNRLLKKHEGIICLIERAAKMSFWELNNAAVSHEEKRARWVALRHSDSPHLLVFEDQFENDIHSVYNTSSYRYDPLHPLNQYEHVNEKAVDLALAKHHELLQTDTAQCPCANSSTPLIGKPLCEVPGCNISATTPVPPNSSSDRPKKQQRKNKKQAA